MAEARLCPDCKSQLIQKNPTKLFIVGILMLGFLVGGFFLSPIFWIEAPISLLIGGFLIVWSVKGKGLWCRNCKTFPSS